MTTDIEGKECPSTHPFAYWNGGQWCCLTNMDKDGNPLVLDSQHCANDAKTKCPHGKCVNYEGKFKNLFLTLSAIKFNVIRKLH